ncbi:hypothetical protein C8Q73DRAFT_94292 [Cubamyces lactineus]|nr:hypothetical protein C8Q73DRAFT_94292 [Cubamyces lactineus]
MAYVILVYRVLARCHPCSDSNSSRVDISVETKPSFTGATITGSIVFGVFFLVLLVALFYYGYRPRPRSPAPIPRPLAEAAQMDDWANRVCELLHLPHAVFIERLREYRAQRVPSRPRADLRGPTAGPRYVPTLHASVGSEWLPPPPYDSSWILPSYSSHRFANAAPAELPAVRASIQSGWNYRPHKISNLTMETDPHRCGSRETILCADGVSLFRVSRARPSTNCRLGENQYSIGLRSIPLPLYPYADIYHIHHDAEHKSRA